MTVANKQRKRDNFSAALQIAPSLGVKFSGYENHTNINIAIELISKYIWRQKIGMDI